MTNIANPCANRLADQLASQILLCCFNALPGKTLVMNISSVDRCRAFLVCCRYRQTPTNWSGEEALKSTGFLSWCRLESVVVSTPFFRLADLSNTALDPVALWTNVGLMAQEEACGRKVPPLQLCPMVRAEKALQMDETAARYPPRKCKRE